MWVGRGRLRIRIRHVIRHVIFIKVQFVYCIEFERNKRYDIYSIAANRHIIILKGQCHEIFCFRFFSWITFPQAPDNNIRIISNFFENSRRYSQVMVYHRCQRHWWQICPQFPLCCWHRYQRHRRQICHRCHWHRWQIIGTISGCRHLKVNLKAKIYIYVSSTTQRWPNKITLIFLIEDFFHFPPVSLTPVANLKLWISPRIFEKIRNGLKGILWGWGKLILEKNQKQKIAWHCPFKTVVR